MTGKDLSSRMELSSDAYWEPGEAEIMPAECRKRDTIRYA